MMVLKTLDVLGSLHGDGSARRIEQISGDLLSVNRGTLYLSCFRQRPQVLKRLALVYEQLRDPGKAAAFLKAYNRLPNEEPWARAIMRQFSALGLV